MNFKKTSISYFKDSQGAIAIMFALTLTPFILGASMAIELTRVFLANTEIAFALDAAAIAAARYTVADASTNGLKIFKANTFNNSANLSYSPALTISDSNTVFSYTVNNNLPLFFSSFLDVDYLRVKGSSTVTKTFNNVEIALVLDNTGSMASDGKIQGLRAAATKFIEIVFPDKKKSDNTVVSIIPYVATVNIGPQHILWLKDPQKLALFPLDEPWAGCVGVVDTGSVMGSDEPPNLFRKWPVYLAGSTYPQYPKGNNDWTTDLIGNSNGGGNSQGAGNSNGIGKLKVITPIKGVNIGPNRSCGLPIIPLTKNKKILLDHISKMTPNNGGGTIGDIGLNWGWNTISPKWKNLWGGVDPKSYDEINNQKYIVIMTDGENNWYAEPGYSPKGDPTAYGFENPQQPGGNLADNLLGTTDIASSRGFIDQRLLSLCTSIKEKNIQIYTVTFRVSNSTAKQIYKQCASSISHAFQAEDSQTLYDVFAVIANLTQGIRIVR